MPSVARRQAVRVVTDSTASLPPALAERWGVDVVPLQVGVDGDSYEEGVSLGTDDLVQAIARRSVLTTSQPSAHAFSLAYERAAATGAQRVVSIHLSGELSGTVHAAALAARTSPVPVDVIDSRTVAMAMGFAVLSAAEAAADGASHTQVAQVALRAASSSRALFVVDSLDHLRRGGRMSAAAAAVGTALGLRPVLGIRAGRIEVVHKIRTRAAVVDRLVTTALDAAAAAKESGTPVRLAMHHLGDDSVVRRCADQITEMTGLAVLVTPVSAVLGAHVGPGLAALVLADEVSVGSLR